MVGMVLMIFRKSLGYPISSTVLTSLNFGMKTDDAIYLSTQLNKKTRRYFDQNSELWLTIKLPSIAPENIESPFSTL